MSHAALIREPLTLTRAALRPIDGRYLLETGEEHLCRAWNVSVSSAQIVGPQGGAPDSAVTCYLDDIGPIAGRIVRITRYGFDLAVSVCPDRLARIEARLAWHAAGSSDQRAAKRIVPTHTAVAVTLPHGEVQEAEIQDLSMLGVALASPARPEIGAVVTVGKRYAAVVRHTRNGFACRFRLPFRPETFNHRVLL